MQSSPMNKPPQNPARARLRELLDIPDRDRTDEQWDELNELEISLAQGNRQGAPQPGQQQSATTASRCSPARNQRDPIPLQPNKRFNRKHKKPR